MKKEDIIANITNDELVEFVKVNVNDTFYNYKDVRKVYRFKDNTRVAVDVFLEDKSNDKEFIMSVFFREDEVEASTTYGNTFMTPAFISLDSRYKKFINAKFNLNEEEMVK